MKLVLFIMTISLFAFADHHEEGKKGERFAKIKAKALENMDKRISQMQANRSCISAAQNKEDMKACRSKMKEHKSEWREKRKEWKEKRKEMKEKRKSRKNKED